MSMNPRITLALLVLAPLVLSQEAPGPTLHVAKKGTVRQTLDRTGTFIAADATELKLDLKRYDARRGGLKIVKVIPHGSFVNKGDIIARLDTTAIDRQIREAKMALELSEMGMRHAEEKVRMDREKAAEQLAKAERDSKRANTRLRGFREHEKVFNEESERLSVSGRKNRLDDQKDELDQLEKMYSEDELVDATEEIVLKRSRRNYARSRQSADLSERRRIYNKEFYQHWREEDYETAARTKATALVRLRRSQEMGRERVDAEMAQRRYRLGRQSDEFAELMRDKEQFVVRAPHKGILLHGRANATAWGELQAGSSLGTSVFASIAQPTKYKVVTTIAEKDLLKLKANTVAQVTPTAARDVKAMGRIQVAFLPSKPGVFKAEIAIDKADLRLRPGLTAKVEVVLGEERDVIVVPVGAVRQTEAGAVVRCAKLSEGPFEDRVVVTGLSDGQHIAIRDGLEEGMFIAMGGK